MTEYRHAIQIKTNASNIIIPILACLMLFIHVNSNFIAITVTPASFIINEITTYTLSINRALNTESGGFWEPVLPVPANAYVDFVFPNNFSSISSTSSPPCSVLGSSVSITCSVNEANKTIKISGIFNDLSLQGAEQLKILIGNIQNSMKATLTGEFYVYVRYQNGTIIDETPIPRTQFTHNNTFSFQPSTFTSCSINANGSYISTQSNFIFSFTLRNAVPATGKIEIELPSNWKWDLVLAQTVVATPICTTITGLPISNIMCSFRQNVGSTIVFITLSPNLATTIPSGSQISFTVSSILTPPFTGSQELVSISSMWSDNTAIDTCSTPVLGTTSIPLKYASFTNLGSSIVQTKFNSSLQLTIARAFSKEDTIILNLPSVFFTNNQIEIESSTFSYFSKSISPSLVVTLSNFTSTIETILEGNILYFTFRNLSNFESIEPQSIRITFYRQSNKYQESSILYAATTGSFSLSISSDSNIVREMNKTTVIVSSELYVETGGYIRMQYSSTITAPDMASTLVPYAAINGNIVTNVSLNVSQNVLTISNLFQSKFNNGTIEIVIPSWVNPPTTRSTTYLFSILSSTSYPIATSSYSYVATPRNFQSLQVNANSLQTMKTSVTYTLTFTTSFSFDAVSVIIPSEIEVSSEYSTTCSPNTYSSCTLVSLSNGSKNLTFKGLSQSGVQTLSWGGNTNPNSFKPTASFSIFTFISGFEVEKSSGASPLVMNVPSKFISLKATPSELENNKIITLSFSLNLPALVPNGIINITVPSTISLASAICPIGQCSKIEPYILIPFENLNSSTFHEVNLTVIGVRNSGSFEPIESFIITLTSNESFLSLSDSIVGWTNTIPSSFSVLVSSNNHFRGEQTLFTFSITDLPSIQTFVNIQINQNFSPLTVAPTGAILVSNYEARFNISGVTSIIISFPLTTPNQKGTYSFELKTYKNPDYLVGKTLSNQWSPDCLTTECKTCSGSNCLTCYQQTVSTYYIYNTESMQCTGDCLSNFYLLNTTCRPCNESCFECSNSSNNCTKCQSPAYLDFEYKTCGVSCRPTYYPNSLNQECSKCLAPCLTCSSQFQCLSCQTGYFLPKDNSCVTSCPINITISNNSTRICDSCEETCLTCSDFVYACTSCNGTLGYFLNEGRCVDVCPAQKFPSGGICANCEAPCRICYNSTTTCSACFSNSTLSLWYNYNCITPSQCAISHYINMINSSCDPCPNQCQTCSSLINCSSCTQNYYLYGVSCLNPCPNTTYHDNSEWKCLPCINCLTCSTPTNCTSCPNNQYLYESACKTECGDGLYPTIDPITSFRTCEVCPLSCPTCRNSTYCESCIQQLYLWKGVCYESCPNSTFNSHPTCTQCPFTCTTCSSLSQCFGCITNYSLENSKCVLVCERGISYEQVCYPCGLHCALCQNTTCSKCASPYLLSKNTCIENCPENALTLDGETCVHCTSKFSSCTTCNQTHCLSCSEGQLTGGECVPCSLGFFSNNSKCVQCPSMCQVCTSSSLCSSCKSGFYFEDNFCVETCPNNKVPNGTKCDFCVENCAVCNLETSLCSICKAGMLIFEGKCQSECPDPYLPSANYTICLTSSEFSESFSKSSKAIYFPFLIVACLLVIGGTVLKCCMPTLHLITFLVSVLSWIELGSWICFGVVELLFFLNYQHHALKGIILVLISLIFLVITNVIFLRCYSRYFASDIEFIKWERNHSCVNLIFLIISTTFNFKTHRFIYSKFMDREEFSLVLSSIKKLIPISILTGISFLVSSLLILVATSFALYYSLNQDQEFFNALDTLCVTSIVTLLMILDVRHPYNYFIDEVETQNIKNKIYEEEDQIAHDSKIKSKLSQGDKFDFEGTSNISRENLIDAVNSANNFDEVPTAKKFTSRAEQIEKIDDNEDSRIGDSNKRKIMNIHGLSETEKENEISKKDNVYLMNEYDEIDEIEENIEENREKEVGKGNKIESKMWIEKNIDQFGYIIKYGQNNEMVRYDKNGWKVEIDENGKHHKFDENGLEVKVDEKTGEIKKYDPKTGFEAEIDEKGEMKLKNEEGYYVRYNNEKSLWETYDPEDNLLLAKNEKTGEYEKFDEEGFRIEKDQYGNIYRYDDEGYRVIVGPNRELQRFDSEGFQIVKDEETGEIKKYDKDGFEMRVDPNTGQMVYYDKFGYRIERDYYGTITRFDEHGNTVILNEETGEIRKFNQEGLEIVSNNQGGIFLKDKRGRKVVNHEGGYEKFDEFGNKIWLDEDGFEIEIAEDGNIIKYDKIGNVVKEETDEEEECEKSGDDISTLKKKKRNSNFKGKEFDYEEEYNKMVLKEKPILLFEEDEEEDDNNLREFHDSGHLDEYQLEKQYETLYFEEQEYDTLRNNKSQSKIHLNLADLHEVNHTPEEELKERRNKLKSLESVELASKEDQDLIIMPESNQDKHSIKSAADISISERSFENEGVQPLSEQSHHLEEDLLSIEEIDTGTNMRNGRSEANFETVNLKKSKNEFNDSKSQVSVSKTENYFNKEGKRVKNKNNIANKQESDEEVSSLGEEDWIQENENAGIFYKDNHTNANSHDKGEDDQSDTLSDYISQTGNGGRYHKASEENYAHRKKMQSIEEVEDELFDKLRSENNKAKRTDFKLNRAPNPLVEYAKTIEAKKNEEETQAKRNNLKKQRNSKKN